MVIGTWEPRGLAKSGARRAAAARHCGRSVDCESEAHTELLKRQRQSWGVLCRKYAKSSMLENDGFPSRLASQTPRLDRKWPFLVAVSTSAVRK